MSDAVIEEIMSFKDLAGLPDYAQLGGRMFVVDGRHVNRVVLNNAGDSRDMGMNAQIASMSLEFSENAAGPFVRGDNVTYAVRRVVKSNGLEIAGSISVAYIAIPLDGENEPAAVAVTLTVTPYEHNVDADVSEIVYEIFRSRPENAQMLYKTVELSQSDVQELENSQYTDLISWDDVSETAEINLDADGTEMSFPPVSYIRAWRGALLGGGYRRRRVALTLDEEDESICHAEAGTVTHDDIGASISCEGGKRSVQIVSLSSDEDGDVIVLSEELTGDPAAAMIWRDDDVLYISRVLPGNIEAYSLENGKASTNSGSGNAITGLAANGTYAYIFRQNDVEILTGTADNFELEPFPGAPPGCRAHATICDKHSPYILYYAGMSGVWMIHGADAKCISAQIANYIRNQLDHTQDSLCHAVFDPGKRQYWLFLFSKDWRSNGIRMPDIFLMYDAVVECWTKGELYASRSGLWRDAANELVPVIGVPGGVARLDAGHTDGGVGIAGNVFGFGDDWFMLTCDNDELTGVIPGMPVYFGRFDQVRRRMVKSVVDGVVTIYGRIPDGVATGSMVSIGNIRWSFTTPEVGISGYFDRTLKLESLSLGHRKTKVEMPVKISIHSSGYLADEDEQQWEGRFDLSTRTVSRLDGRATGLRGASFQATFCGESAPVVIKAVRIDADKVAR